ncbi:PREDICTED: transmembrane protein 176B isoform X3 [Myotis brandtii]|nr:PREDICTED: transmembrane protein 176B isoform X3 [Myotis brandtii]XP_005861590.1 PREDICTED: transmembrane protein 176B isoform X3 [Myotis brandtii]XP_014391353.1 PREDICTED: transmembrane protein 176B isoform X3 [Myotis brandtii]
MAQSMVTVNGVDVDSILSQPTHINIHIHQESFLTQLIKAGGSLKEFFIGSRDTSPPTTRISYGPLAGGVTQILLGAVSCAFGVFLYFGPWTELRGSGCAFWSGSVAIIAGVGTIVHEKQRSILSSRVSGLLTLAGIGTALAAIVLCVKSITWESDDLLSSVCDRPAPPTTTTDYRWRRRSYRNSDWWEDRCKISMELLKNLFLGIRILLLAVCTLQVIVSVASLGLGLRSLCGQSSQPMGEEETVRKLRGENSVPTSPSKEKTTSAMVQ